MRWDYPPLDVNPVFPGLGEIIIIVIFIIIIIISSSSSSSSSIITISIIIGIITYSV